ncbi:hypothetical protein D3C78_1022790 [compost metagenome]
MVDFHQLPGVLVEVHVALGVDVPLAGLQGGLHVPYAVQLVAAQVLVDVALLDDVGVFHVGRLQLVAVVRDVQFLLADQFPVVAVRGAVHHVGVVGGAHAVGSLAGCVVGQFRGAAHAALAGVVDPGFARFGNLVDGLVGHRHGACQTSRTGYREDVVEQHVLRFGRVNAVHVLREAVLVGGLDHGVGTVGLRCRLRGETLQVAAAVAGDVVPVHLDAAFRNREGVVARFGEIDQRVAVVAQLYGHGAFLRRVVDALRCRCGAMARIDRDLVGVRIALEHRLLAGGQLGLVLVGVGRGDDEQRLLAGERIAEEALAIHRRSAGLETAVPGRDAAVGVAGLFRAERGEGGTQLGRFLRGDGGHYSGGQQRQRQGAGFQDRGGFHAWFLCQVDQKFTPKLSAT